jgi:hypothetical protein
MAANTFLNGFSGTVLAASYALDITEWDCDIETEILDTTNTSGYDSGTARAWQTNINGVSKATGSVKTYYDSGNVPTGATVNIRNGTSVTLQLNIGNTGKSIAMTARVGKVTINNPVKAVVPFEFTFESTGIVTLPS